MRDYLIETSYELGQEVISEIVERVQQTLSLGVTSHREDSHTVVIRVHGAINRDDAISTGAFIRGCEFMLNSIG